MNQDLVDEALQNTDHRNDYLGKMDAIRDKLINDLGQLYNLVEDYQDYEFIYFPDLHQYELNKFEPIRKMIDPNNGEHVAIYNRMSTQTKKYAAIIELSHLPSRNFSQWDMRRIVISKASYDEAFNFIVHETLKTLSNLLGGLRMDAQEKENRDIVLDKLKSEYETLKEKHTNGQSTIEGVSRTKLKRKTRLNSKALTSAMIELEDDGIIEVFQAVKGNNKPTEIIVFNGKNNSSNKPAQVKQIDKSENEEKIEKNKEDDDDFESFLVG